MNESEATLVQLTQPPPLLGQGIDAAVGDSMTGALDAISRGWPRGQTIYLTHDTNLPRPYSRKYVLQGTKGLVEGYPRRVYVEGMSEKEDRWDSVDRWFESHDHPLWRSDQVKQATRGHGGMDFLEDWRLIHCLRKGLPTDQNVYDAAAWSVICATTEQSVASRSKPISIPDFTRGRWKAMERLVISG